MKQALEQASKASKFVSLFLDISDSSLLSLCTRFSILAMHHLDHGEYHVADLLTWGVVWYKKISGPFYFDHHHVIHFEDFPHDYTKTKNLLLSSQILHYPNPKQSCPYNILVLPCLLWQDIISLVQPPLSTIPTDLPCLALPIPLIQSSPSPFLELQQTSQSQQTKGTNRYVDLQTLFLFTSNSNTTHQPRCFLSMKPRDFTPTHLLKGRKLAAKIRNTSSPLLSSPQVPWAPFEPTKGD